jgi:hypothetical protein
MELAEKMIPLCFQTSQLPQKIPNIKHHATHHQIAHRNVLDPVWICRTSDLMSSQLHDATLHNPTIPR